jgi:DNA-directed RNA polymerase beta' subunit
VDTTPAGDPADQVDIPPYDVQVPDAVTALLRSENPQEFQTGVKHLANGVLQIAHRSIVSSVRKELRSVLPQIIAQNVTQIIAQQHVKSDFYGKYSALNKPVFHGIVAQAGMEVARELGKTAWDEELRDKIAERVFSLFGQIAPATAPAAAPRAPAFTPSGARPAAPVPLTDQAKHIADLF